MVGVLETLTARKSGTADDRDRSIAWPAAAPSALMFVSIVSARRSLCCCFIFAPLPLMVAALGGDRLPPRRQAHGGNHYRAIFGFPFASPLSSRSHWLCRCACGAVHVDLSGNGASQLRRHWNWYPIGRICYGIQALQS